VDAAQRTTPSGCDESAAFDAGFAELGFDSGEAENRRVRAASMGKLRRFIRDLTGDAASTLLHTTRARIRQLVDGRIDSFSIDVRVSILGHANAQLCVVILHSEPTSPT
jgi:predicted XRE-type DNA-binding protein